MIFFYYFCFLLLTLPAVLLVIYFSTKIIISVLKHSNFVIKIDVVNKDEHDLCSFDEKEIDFNYIDYDLRE